MAVGVNMHNRCFAVEMVAGAGRNEIGEREGERFLKAYDRQHRRIGDEAANG
jgi:hypothetical protein